MSADGGGAAGRAAWPSETHSVTVRESPTRPNSIRHSERTPVEELPTVDEVLAEVVNEFPHLVGLRLSEEDRRKLRAEVVDEEREERYVKPEYRLSEEQKEWFDEEGNLCRSELVFDSSFFKSEVTERRAVTWGEAVRAFLEWYESYRYKTLKFGKGRPDTGERETFEIEARNSWQPEYQQAEFARLKALERQTVGYDTCGECGSYFCRRSAEHETAREPGTYEEPIVALITRSASSTPDGEHVPPVEHDRALVEAWEPVYHTLRNQLRAAGFSREEWVYHRQGEPHEGGGEASAYGHEHTALIIDVAGHEYGVDEVEELLRPVVDKHVEACEWAEEAAHGEGALEVRGVGSSEEEIQSPASYVAKYLSVDGGTDLFERSPEYLMWGAVQWATNTQKGVRSANANHAVTADLCTQDYHNPERSQVHRHGEFTRESSKRGHERECAECGSPWGVDQEHGTNVERRLMADGGTVEAESPEVVQRTLEAAMVAGPEPVDAELVDEVLREESSGEEEIVACAEWVERCGLEVRACGRLNCKEPEEHETERISLRGSAEASAVAKTRFECRECGGSHPVPFRIAGSENWSQCGEVEKEVVERVEAYVSNGSEKSETEVLGSLLLNPRKSVVAYELGVLAVDEERESFERPPEWELESVVDGRYRECMSCAEEYEAHHGRECPRCGSEATQVRESAASPGHVDMRELYLPEERRRERRKAIIEAMEGPA